MHHLHDDSIVLRVDNFEIVSADMAAGQIFVSPVLERRDICVDLILEHSSQIPTRKQGQNLLGQAESKWADGS